MSKAFILLCAFFSVCLSLKESCKSLEEKFELLSHKFDALEKRCTRSQYNLGNLQQNDDGRSERLLLDVNENANQPISFSAYMSHSFNGPNFGQLREIVYDQVENNIGNGYNNYTGTFRVPVDGVYAFTWTIYVQGAKDSLGELSVELVVNNVMHGVIHADSELNGDDDTATGFVIKSLKVGDAVFTRVSNAFHAQGTEMSNHYARWTYSGFKIN